MDRIIQKEEIRKGILWDGDSSIVFKLENNDSVQELVTMIEESAERQGLSYDEMVNKIIFDYVSDQIRSKMVNWIRRMEYPEHSRRECEFSNTPGEDAELIDVCRYFLDHTKDTHISPEDEQEVAIMRDLAKNLILLDERGRG